nr:auxin-responsive protein SAUR36-like [Ipomoea batatas]
MAVYVGQKDGDFKRILVPVMYFNHPLFGELLREAENEFGSVIPAGSPFVAGSRSLSGSRPGSSKARNKLKWENIGLNPAATWNSIKVAQASAWLEEAKQHHILQSIPEIMWIYTHRRPAPSLSIRLSHGSGTYHKIRKLYVGIIMQFAPHSCGSYRRLNGASAPHGLLALLPIPCSF